MRYEALERKQASAEQNRRLPVEHLSLLPQLRFVYVARVDRCCCTFAIFLDQARMTDAI